MSIALAALAVLAQAAPAAQPQPPAPAGDLVPEIEVVARRPVVGDLQQGVNAYRPEFFLPVRPGTALDMVAWLPGFVFEDTRDVRGLEGSTGNVLIDGKPPTSKTDTLQSVLKRIPASQVERIDIIVGGSPSIDMHGRNVIANVVLKAAATKRRVVMAQTLVDRKGRASPQLQLSTTRKYDGKIIEGAIDLARNNALYPSYGYGPWVRYDGDGTPLFRADTTALVGGYSAGGSGAYETPFAGGQFRANGLIQYHGTRIHEDDFLVPGPGGFSRRYSQSYVRSELGLRYERAVGRATLETQVLERLTDLSSFTMIDRPPAPTTVSSDGLSQESVIRAVMRFKKDETFSLQASAEGAFNTSHNLSTATLDGAPQVLPTPDVHVDERRGETGVAVVWKPNGKVSVDTALKLEASDLTASGDVNANRSFIYLKPKAAVSWSPDKNTQLRLRIEHEVEQVDVTYFWTAPEINGGASGQVRGGNVNLRPQRSYVAEAVLERQFWSGGSLVLSARRRTLRDVVDVAPVATPFGIFGVISNIGDGGGSELSANLTVPLKRIGWGGMILKGVIKRDTVRVTDPIDGRRRLLSGDSPWIAEAHLAQDLPRWKTNWGIDAFYRGGSVLYRPFGNEELHDWTHVNVFVEYRFTPANTLRVEVQNLPGQNPLQRTAVFSGLRGQSPLSYVDEKRLTAGPILLLRLRRTFE